jgi:hypothetical protein
MWLLELSLDLTYTRNVFARSINQISLVPPWCVFSRVTINSSCDHLKLEQWPDGATGPIIAWPTRVDRITLACGFTRGLADSIQIESQPSAPSAELQGCKRLDLCAIPDGDQFLAQKRLGGDVVQGNPIVGSSVEEK